MYHFRGIVDFHNALLKLWISGFLNTHCHSGKLWHSQYASYDQTHTLYHFYLVNCSCRGNLFCASEGMVLFQHTRNLRHCSPDGLSQNLHINNTHLSHLGSAGSMVLKQNSLISILFLLKRYFLFWGTFWTEFLVTY